MNPLYDEHTFKNAFEKLKKMVLREGPKKSCAKDEDVFDHHLQAHEGIAKMLHIPTNFRAFHLYPENLAFFDAWDWMIRGSAQKLVDAVWDGAEVQSQQQVDQMVKGQIAVGKWQIFFFSNFLAGRGRRFRLGSNLAPVLMHTDVKIPAIELYPPYDFMAVQLPSGILDMVEAGKAPIECRYLIISRQALVAGDMMDEYTASEKDIEFLSVLALSEPKGNDEYGDLTLVDTMALREGKTVDEEIQAYVERRKIHSLGHHLQVELPEGKVRYGNSIANIFALAANIILYTTNRSADVVPHNQATLDKILKQVNKHQKGSKKGRRAQKKLQEAKKISIHIIGGGFKPKDGRMLEYQKTDRVVSVRHLVRGHWKMQAYGPERKESKHIFVEPYWRGPELAEMVERDYVLRLK